MRGDEPHTRRSTAYEEHWRQNSDTATWLTTTVQFFLTRLCPVHHQLSFTYFSRSSICTLRDIAPVLSSVEDSTIPAWRCANLCKELVPRVSGKQLLSVASVFSQGWGESLDVVERTSGDSQSVKLVCLADCRHFGPPISHSHSPYYSTYSLSVTPWQHRIISPQSDLLVLIHDF